MNSEYFLSKFTYFSDLFMRPQFHCNFNACLSFYNYVRAFRIRTDDPRYWSACDRCLDNLARLGPAEARRRFDDEVAYIRGTPMLNMRIRPYEDPLFDCLKGKDLDGAVAILVEVFRITEGEARSRLKIDLIANTDTDDKIRIACRKLLYPGLGF